MMDKIEKLLEIFNAIFDRDVDEKIKKDNEEWDSFKHIEILSTIEEEFDIRIKPEDIPQLTSFNKILEYLDNE